ncbi:hypothetical protein [Fibrella aquatilis]|uniref:Uracil DNA glycosylase superfamily protein n=1 Tax=Fibrella aquatilis TaxID=2817059 RepID=A0A939K0F8_9BACT|nr:hypothetical protein [Fibrella aquatilis]MBO0934149.1 hypothetical protein [Fibrella aquatilis]
MNTDLQAEFVDLYKKLGLVDYSNLFISDGIINDELCNKQKIKILFIAKEHNKLNREYEDNPSYSDWWKQHVMYTFSHRISEWAYGISNNFPPYAEAQDADRKHEALKSIAFINVKKVCGGSSSNSAIIGEYIIKTRSLLLRQIQEIAPTIIICCFKYNWFVEALFGVENVNTASNDWGFYTWKGINIVNYFHPSSRKSKLALYDGLREAVRFLDTYSGAE